MKLLLIVIMQIKISLQLYFYQILIKAFTNPTGYPLKNSWGWGTMWLLSKQCCSLYVRRKIAERLLFNRIDFWAKWLQIQKLTNSHNQSLWIYLFFSLFGLIISSPHCHWPSSLCLPVFNFSPPPTSLSQRCLVPSTGHQFKIISAWTEMKLLIEN